MNRLRKRLYGAAAKLQYPGLSLPYSAEAASSTTLRAERVTSDSDYPDETASPYPEYQLQFLETLLMTLNGRRHAVDARAAVVCTISIALAGFLLSQSDTLYGGLPSILPEILPIIALVPTFIAVIKSVSLIAPVRRFTAVRGTRPRSLTWFYRIPELSLAEYRNSVKKLSTDDVVDQTAKQIYELSILLRARYRQLISTCRYLGAGLILTLGTVLVKLISTVLGSL